MNYYLTVFHFNNFFPLEPAQMSVYASWYKQSYPDQVLSLSAMSNDGLVSVGKKHALKKYDQFALNTGCFLEKYQIKYYLSCAIIVEVKINYVKLHNSEVIFFCNNKNFMKS